jgi:hypothetical protein
MRKLRYISLPNPPALERPRNKLVDNIKIGLVEIGWGGVIQDRDK